jgi:hypothetical protein
MILAKPLLVPPQGAKTGADVLRERCLIASILESPGTEWPPNLRRCLDYPELFNDPDCSVLAVAIRKASTNGHTPDFMAVSRHLTAEQINLLSVFTGERAIPLGLAEIEAETFLGKIKARRVVSTLGEAYEAAQAYPGQAQSIAAKTKHALEQVESDAGVNTMSDRLAARLYRAESQIVRPDPRYSIGGGVICTAGNLTTISAQAKQGKTAATAAMIASTFAKPDADCLGFGSHNPNGHAVIHIDTEQSLFDHHDLVENIAKRAGWPVPPWVRSYCLTGFNADVIRQAVPVLLEQAQKEFGGIHSLLLDGSADAVHDVNDPEEANGFVSELHALCIKFNCPLVCAIHLNPGSDFKTRGHLGSQLERKAETNLKIEKQDEASVLWAEKNRHAPILKSTGPRFAWCIEAGMHISVESAALAKAELEREELTKLFKGAFSSRPAMSHGDLKVTVKKAVTVSDKTAERRITQAVTLEIIKKTFAGLYELRG